MPKGQRRSEPGVPDNLHRGQPTQDSAAMLFPDENTEDMLLAAGVHGLL